MKKIMCLATLLFASSDVLCMHVENNNLESFQVKRSVGKQHVKKSKFSLRKAATFALAGAGVLGTWKAFDSFSDNHQVDALSQSFNAPVCDASFWSSSEFANDQKSCIANDQKMAKYLSEHEANVNLDDQLIRASHSLDADDIGLLIKHGGADVNYKGKNEQTALSEAWVSSAQFRNMDGIEAAKCLIYHGADINTKINDLNLMEYAVIYDAPDLVDLLIKKGVDINEPNERGETPLVILASLGEYQGSPDMITTYENTIELRMKSLIKRGAKIDKSVYYHALRRGGWKAVMRLWKVS